jgi:hypothetical protein
MSWEYRVVFEPTIAQFEAKVNDLSREGFTVYGNFSLIGGCFTILMMRERK